MFERTMAFGLGEFASRELDVLVIGSGPAGVAVAERLYLEHPKATIGIAERGPILTLTHINNIFPNAIRRSFIDRFKIRPWEGTFRDGGMLLPALGGRGIAAGAHLRRFDQDDFALWPDGVWPAELVDALPNYYRDAEEIRRVNVGSLRGPAQMWALGALNNLHPHPPNIGVDLSSVGGFDVGQGYDSPAARLWKLLLRDVLESEDRRLYLVTSAYATLIEHTESKVEGAWLLDVNTASGSRGGPQLVRAKSVVVAASTVESARLLLLSGLERDRPALGRYLSEHVERRAKIEVDLTVHGSESQGVSLVIPPAGTDAGDRFQIHLRGQKRSRGTLEIDIGGFAAMDPQPNNRVELSEVCDDFGIRKAHTHLELSEADLDRASRMVERIRAIASMLQGRFITERFPVEGGAPRFTDQRDVQLMDLGRSYHESGTLRMGSDSATSVADSYGKVRGIDNLFVADASLFPCVGIANPMLTITALAYRVADRVGHAVAPNKPL